MADNGDRLVIEPSTIVTSAEIESICQSRSESENPPQAFVISSAGMKNSLLAVRTDFLDEGECLPWPGLSLLGATFNLDWGYAFVDVKTDVDGQCRFKQPSCRFEDSATGDTSGYRLCPIDDREMIQTIDELAQIRKKVSEPRRTAPRRVASQVIVANL